MYTTIYPRTAMPIVDPNPPRSNGPSNGPRCSFCGRRAEDTERLVSGPGVYICATCIRQATDLVGAAEQGADAADAEALPDPGGSYTPRPEDYCLAFAALHALSAPMYDMIVELGPGPEQALDMLAEELRYEHCLQQKHGEVLDTSTTVHHAVEALVCVSLDVHHRIH